MAVDYGLFLMARHREQMDAGMGLIASAARAEGTSGAAIVVAGGTVVISILGLYVSGVAFVGALGLAAAVVVAVTIGAAYGVIVAIFQWGWGASLIGVHTTLPIPAYVPMLVFAIVFGLSMDYEVFLLSRVHEAWIETGDPHRAVAVGIGATARVITTAAAIMVVVFASFVLSTDPTVKMLAIGMAFAVLIDASLVRMILVPSVMALLDARAWWMPRWLEPIVPHLQLEEGSAAPASAAEPADRPAAEEPVGPPVVTTATGAAAEPTTKAPATADGAAAPADAATGDGAEAPADAATRDGAEAPADAATGDGAEAPAKTPARAAAEAAPGYDPPPGGPAEPVRDAAGSEPGS